MKAWLYITASKPNGVIYVGITTELKYRIESHKNKKYTHSFSARYNVDKLVYYEEYPNILPAREFEIQLKGGSRRAKIKLIEAFNPEWEDLYDTLT
jgi:putative endonuclease